MGRWGDGEMGRWGDGEMGRWGDGEMGRWGDGEMGRWGDGEMGRWGDGRWGDGEMGGREEGCESVRTTEEGGDKKDTLWGCRRIEGEPRVNEICFHASVAESILNSKEDGDGEAHGALAHSLRAKHPALVGEGAEEVHGRVDGDVH